MAKPVTVADAVVLHPITGPPGSRLAALLGHGLEPVAPFRGTIGGFARVVASVSAAESEIAAARRGLPDGDALSEAVAVRLLRSGHEIVWGPPLVVDSVRSLLEFCRSRGRSAVELARSDPSLVPELQIGAWFDAPWRTRSLRSFAGAESNDWIARLALLSERWLKTAADFAFWAGARDRSTAPEWRRLTRSSYVALVYHRFAGELKPGQERIDIAPRRFERQLRALRMIRCHPLSPEEVLSFHVGRADRLADRSFVITVDDALADCVLPLARHSQWSPQLFVCTQEMGRKAHWIADEPVATWTDVKALAAAGVAVGSHARRHRRLSSLPDAVRDEELAGSLADLREHLANPLEIVAFPNGDHDRAVCRAARAAGFRAAYTTQNGRNGAVSDPHCLRRVSVHGHDGALAVIWKVLTGEPLPAAWLGLRAARLAARREVTLQPRAPTMLNPRARHSDCHPSVASRSRRMPGV